MAAETVGSVKIVGYLEKKGKMKVVTKWKKYWFVLEGRLLLYYRSQEEYENLSPCKGSINMGLATNIRPGLATAGVFQIITRTNTITLRAKERCIQEKWLQALLDATGQQSATNPIKMSHFRYSMDDLIPTGAKQPHHRTVLTRQNTLPNRFKNVKIDRQNSIINRIRSLGGQSYGGSLDTINKLSKIKTHRTMSKEEQLQKINDKQLTETESEVVNDMYQRNDLYNEMLIENAQYISADNREETKKDVDLNKNCYIIENDQYIKTDDISSLKNEEHLSTQSDNSSSRPDDLEYYCTYEDINNIKALREQEMIKEQDIYDEPNFELKREEKKSDSDETIVSKFARFARRLKSLTENDSGVKKKKSSLIQKVMGKKKSDEAIVVEPIYDTVNYLELNKSEQKQMQNPPNEQLIKTLIDLQQTLEAKKSKLKEIIGSSSTETETPVKETKEAEETSSTTSTSQPEPDESCNPPGLPPRRGSKSRSRSPFHDVPKNNSPVKLTNPEQLPDVVHQTDYSIDKILNDLENESRKFDPKTEELSVRQLIEKFNSVGSEENILQASSMSDNTTTDVFLRQKSEDSNEDLFLNRHSDELNKLLEELTKVTSAPLMTPGVTSSLVQMKSQPLTDEEWLAIAPIRRRRHSEPDYDVPRPHRSLQILPRSPDKENNEDNEIIPATRFFGPVLPPTINDKSSTDQSMSWRSMTPDSLEPLQLLQAAIRKQRLEANSDVEQDRSVGYEKASDSETELSNGNRNYQETKIITNDFSSKQMKHISLEMKSNDNYLDSLEPLNESATAF